MKHYKEKKQKLVTDIIKNYHYTRWVEQMKKSIDEIPEAIQVIYFRFGTIAEFPPATTKEEKQQLAELNVIRKKLKKFYKKEHE